MSASMSSAKRPDAATPTRAASTMPRMERKEPSAGANGYRDRNSTAERALDILMMFTDERTSVSASEVASHLEVARSTAYRYIQSLANSGFVEEGASGGFQLGPRILELARIARRSGGLTDVARPLMRHLADSTGETVLLTRLTGFTVFCSDRAESVQRAMRISYEPGQTMPANAGASAHVLLAWLPEAELDEFLSHVTFERFTRDTITTPAGLRKRLRETRRLGYAISRGELDLDVLGIAAPIRDATDRVIAGISVAASATRVHETDVPAMAKAVCGSADLISARLRLLAG
jgi:DNA-binding IclR family transcriptional regulator